MKRAPQMFILFLGIMLALIFLQTARADFILHPWENFYSGQATSQIQYRLSYFQTTTNYTATGKLSSPAGLKEYQRLQNDIYLRWGWTDRDLIFLRLSWAHLNQVSLTSPGRRWGLTDQSIGLNRCIFAHPVLRINAQAQLDFPGYTDSNQTRSPSPALGDGSLDFTLGIFLEAPLIKRYSSTLSLMSGMGYLARHRNFSSALPFTLGLLYSSTQKGVFAHLINYSLISLKTDPYAKDPSNYRSTQRSGGSYLLQAMNPSISQLQLKVGYEWRSEKKLWLSATQSIWGQMTPEHHQFNLSFEFPLNPPQPSENATGEPSKQNAQQEPPPLLTPHSTHPAHHPTQPHTSALKQDAQVLRSHDRLNLIKINQGSSEGVLVGQLYQIYNPTLDPQLKQLIAQGKVTHLKPHESIIEINEFFYETWIEEGFLARPFSQ